jgi:hypothetical protein
MVDTTTTGGRTGADSKPDILSVAGLASIVAGIIHATAAGSHSDHKAAVWAFAGCALFQLAWGGWALLRSNRLIALVGALGNAALFGAWVLAKVDGISFVKGLDEVEPVQFADGLAAGLAAVSVLLVFMHLVGGPQIARSARNPMLTVAAGVAIALALPGMVAAGNHHHDEAGHTHADGETAAGHVHTPSAVPVKKYDGKLPVDLSGVPGVSKAELTRAENLVTITIKELPQWSDPAYAYSKGYRSIGDAATGVEHYIKWDTINDKHVLDPNYPEALVYEVNKAQRTFLYPIDRPPPPHTRKLVSAMFMFPEGTTLQTTPDIGGPLTQMHIHDNLCFDKDPRVSGVGAQGPRVIGVTRPNGSCGRRGFKLTPVPMIHVWIVGHPCGPFAALEGVGGGQVKEGETQACDHVHGDSNVPTF